MMKASSPAAKITKSAVHRVLLAAMDLLLFGVFAAVSLILIPWKWIWVASAPLLFQKKFAATRSLSLSLAVFSALLFAFSFYAKINAPLRHDPVARQKFSDAPIPYQMHAPFSVREQEMRGVYRFKAHHGKLGLRGNNLERGISAEQVLVLAMGCSFTYGIGVADNETIPAQLESISGGKIQALNLGVPNGSPLEMIAIIYNLNHYLAGAAQEAQTPVLIYTAIDEHVQRVAKKGYFRWSGLDSPDLIRVSPTEFALAPVTGPLSWPVSWMNWVRNSIDREVYRWFLHLIRGAYSEKRAYWAMDEETVELYLASIEFAAKGFFRKFPNGIFILNAWINRPDFLAALSRLPDEIRVVRLPSVSDLPSFPGDGHPTAEAYKTVANYLYPIVLEEVRHRRTNPRNGEAWRGF